MIRDVKINTLDELMPLLTEQDYQEKLKRFRTDYLYRGMPDAEFHMATSLSRNCKDLQCQLERAMLDTFAKYAVMYQPDISDSVWNQMIVGQHNGLPTRLLDWSHSALVGLHFATIEPSLENMEMHDAVVWRIDMNELASLLPIRYREETERTKTRIFSVDMLKNITNDPAQYDEDMGDQAMVIIEPPSTMPRIVNQYSFFSIVPMKINDVEEFLNRRTENTVRYVIDRHLRWRIRDMLDQLNISERIMYPGLDGLSSWVARHYYVK